MSGTMPTGTELTPSHKTSVSPCADARYASHHARWKAQRENGVAHGFAATSASHVARSIESKGRGSAVNRRVRSGGELVGSASVGTACVGAASVGPPEQSGSVWREGVTLER